MAKVVVKLTIQEPGQQPRTFTGSGPSILIGRKEDADVRLSADGIEDEHALIKQSEKGFMIEALPGAPPLKFDNGVFKDKMLKSGDNLQVGVVKILVELESSDSPSIARILQKGQGELKLIVSHPLRELQELVFNQDKVTIGRAKSCDVVIDDPGVMQHHVTITRSPTGYVLSRQPGPSSVKVNGEIMDTKVIYHGDEIQVGQATLRVNSMRRQFKTMADLVLEVRKTLGGGSLTMRESLPANVPDDDDDDGVAAAPVKLDKTEAYKSVLGGALARADRGSSLLKMLDEPTLGESKSQDPSATTDQGPKDSSTQPLAAKLRTEVPIVADPIDRLRKDGSLRPAKPARPPSQIQQATPRSSHPAGPSPSPSTSVPAFGAPSGQAAGGPPTHEEVLLADLLGGGGRGGAEAPTSLPSTEPGPDGSSTAAGLDPRTGAPGLGLPRPGHGPSHLHLVDQVPLDPSATWIGGFWNFKAWVTQGQQMLAQLGGFRPPFPRGITLIGLPGCGRKYAARALAAVWGVPLMRFRLDTLLSQRPELWAEGLHHWMASAVSLSPSVLLVNDIDWAFSSYCRQHPSLQAQVIDFFGSLVSTLRQGLPNLFMAYTCSDSAWTHRSLLIRGGMVDEVFFVDLPEPRARGEIIWVHLGLAGLPAEQFELARLIPYTEGFSAAQLAQMVREAVSTAQTSGRAPTLEDLGQVAARTPPMASGYPHRERIRNEARAFAVPA